MKHRWEVTLAALITALTTSQAKGKEKLNPQVAVEMLKIYECGGDEEEIDDINGGGMRLGGFPAATPYKFDSTR